MLAPSQAGKPAFHLRLSDWSPRPHAILQQTCAAIWARKSRPYLGDRTHPENRLTPISVRAMKHMANVQREMAACYPADDSRIASELRMLHGQLPPGTNIIVGGRSMAAYQDILKEIEAFQLSRFAEMQETLDRLRYQASV